VFDRETKNTKNIARGLDIPLEEFKSSRKIILENAAGEGNKLGSTLDEIGQIISGVREDLRPQLKVCIDTAHIFGAGQYDFGKAKEVKRFYRDFDQKIGLDYLEVFHLNDSRVAYGSRKDRHENLGLGYIFGVERNEEMNGDGLEGLKALVEEAEKRRIPLIGEPPHKTKNGSPAPGGFWDYQVLRQICNLDEEVFVCED